MSSSATIIYEDRSGVQNTLTVTEVKEGGEFKIPKKDYLKDVPMNTTPITTMINESGFESTLTATDTVYEDLFDWVAGIDRKIISAAIEWIYSAPPLRGLCVPGMISPGDVKTSKKSSQLTLTVDQFKLFLGMRLWQPYAGRGIPSVILHGSEPLPYSKNKEVMEKLYGDKAMSFLRSVTSLSKKAAGAAGVEAGKMFSVNFRLIFRNVGVDITTAEQHKGAISSYTNLQPFFDAFKEQGIDDGDSTLK